MKIVLVSLNYAPELTGIGRYNTEMVQWFVGRGHSVRVIVAPPYYPAWKVPETHCWWQFRREEIDGATIVRCPTWVPSRPNGWRRIVHLASFAVSSSLALAASVRWRPDVVLVTQPPIIATPAVIAFSALTGARSWMHVQDLEIAAAFGLGYASNGVFRRVVLGIERAVLRRFDVVSTISISMRTRLAEQLPENRSVEIARNWVDLDAIRPVDSSGLRSSLGIHPDAIVCLYSGSMAAKQGLDILASAAHALKDRNDLYFVFCGNGAMRPALEQDASGMERVRFMNLQPEGQLAELLSLADIHLLPQRAEIDGLAMPSKLSGMFASARPVVATAVASSELAKVVTGRGTVVPPGDIVAFALAISELADDPAKRAAYGQAGRAYAERALNKNVVLADMFRALLGGVEEDEAVSTGDGDVAVPAPATTREQTL